MAAIYMWFVNGVQYQILTTTLYPIELIDSLQLGAQLGPGCYMRQIPNEQLDHTQSLVSSTLRQILKITGPYLDALDHTQSLVSMSLPQILSVLGPYLDALDHTQSLVSMNLDLALVTVDTPDEELLFTCGLSTSDCSLTPI